MEDRCTRLERRVDKAKRDNAWAYEELKRLDRAMQRRLKGASSGGHPGSRASERAPYSHHKESLNHRYQERWEDPALVQKVSQGNQTVADSGHKDSHDT